LAATCSRSIDQLLALLRIGIGQERLHLVRAGKQTAGIERGPANELRVRAQLRRLDTQLLQLRECMIVDEVILRMESLRIDGRIERHVESGDGDFDLKHGPNRDRSLSKRLHLARRRDLQISRVIRIEFREPGDVLAGAVAEGRRGGELHFVAEMEHSGWRRQFQPRYPGIILVGPREAGLDPGEEQVVFRAAEGKNATAFVRRLCRGL
jgi:hypothetical protein